MKRVIDYTVTDSDADKTIHMFLREHFFPAKIITILKHTENSVCLNGESVFLNTMLNAGDRLTINYSED